MLRTGVENCWSSDGKTTACSTWGSFPTIERSASWSLSPARQMISSPRTMPPKRRITESLSCTIGGRGFGFPTPATTAVGVDGKSQVARRGATVRTRKRRDPAAAWLPDAQGPQQTRIIFCNRKKREVAILHKVEAEGARLQDGLAPWHGRNHGSVGPAPRLLDQFSARVRFRSWLGLPRRPRGSISAVSSRLQYFGRTHHPTTLRSSHSGRKRLVAGALPAPAISLVTPSTAKFDRRDRKLIGQEIPRAEGNISEGPRESSDVARFANR